MSSAREGLPHMGDHSSEPRCRVTLTMGRERQGDSYWPPPRRKLHSTKLDLLTLHNFRSRAVSSLGFDPRPSHLRPIDRCSNLCAAERRPRLIGSRAACHAFAPELSGAPALPTSEPPSSLVITVSLHAIGGFCAVCNSLPPPEVVETAVTTAVEGNGLNPAINFE
eukprot:3553549-Prymnesium_polylepis.2